MTGHNFVYQYDTTMSISPYNITSVDVIIDLKMTALKSMTWDKQCILFHVYYHNAEHCQQVVDCRA